MTIKQALADAIQRHDLAALRRIVDRLRTAPPAPCAPFGYADLLALAQRAVPGLTPEAWEMLLYEVDSEEGKE